MNLDALALMLLAVLQTNRRASIANAESGSWHATPIGSFFSTRAPPPPGSAPTVSNRMPLSSISPGFSVGEDAYYLEDMILITATGHEVLSAGLPYTAEEIARQPRSGFDKPGRPKGLATPGPPQNRT